MGSNNKVTVVIAGDNQLSKTLGEVQSQLGGFARVASGIGTALKALAVGEVIRGLVDLGKGALENADNFAKMSQRTGVSVQDLSALAYAAKLSGTDIGGLEVGLKKLNKTLSDASAGMRPAQQALTALGVKPSEYKNTAEALGSIADKFASMKDGPEKAALAVQVFGKQGTALIPMLNEGRRGLAALRAEAERLGVVLSNEDAARAQELQDNIERLDFAVHGLAQRFMAGLIPALGDVVSALSDTNTPLDTMTFIGDKVGTTLKYLVLGFESLGIGVAFAAHKLGLFADAMLQFASGDFKKSADAISQMIGSGEDVQGDYLRARLGQIQEKLFPEKRPPAPKLRDNSGLSDGSRVQADADAIEKARIKKEMDDAKLAVDFSKSMNELELASTEEMYKHQLISVEEYYDKKRKLQADSLSAEIFALQQEKQIQKEAASKAEKEGRERDHIEALGALSRISEQLTVKTAELNAVLGKTAAGDDDPIRRRIQSMEQAAAAAGLVSQKIDAIYAKLDGDVADVTRNVDTYQITALDGEKQINELRAQAADKLEILAQKYEELAAESRDSRLMEQAVRLKTQIKDLQVEVHRLRDELVGDIQGSMETFFSDMISGSKSAGEAFADFAKSIIADIAKIIAKMLAMWTVQKLIGLAGSLFGFGIGKGPASAAGPDFMAAGGTAYAGSPYIVGEAGPELFVPRTTGVIVPNSQLGGGSQSVVVNINAPGATAETAARLERMARQIADVASRQALATLQDRQRRV